MEKARIIELPKIEDARGNLTVLQLGKFLPFDIKRVFWTYDVPGGVERGGHAYRSTAELIIALSGSFTVKVGLDEAEDFTLNRSYYGLLIPPMNWRVFTDFSTNAVVLSLVDKAFDPADYIREPDELGV
jgi:dTDP-4-dehydrorhamnose 3,5-epimerase-like enzyme